MQNSSGFITSKNKMNYGNNQAKKRKTLLRKIDRLHELLRCEEERTREVWSRIPWGAGMRRASVGPSLRRENELREKLRMVETELASLQEN